MLREINIRPVLNGFVAQIGCQSLAYTSVDKLVLDLGAYLRDPEETEKRIIKEEGFNRKHTLDVPTPALACDTAAPMHATECAGIGAGAMIGGRR